MLSKSREVITRGTEQLGCEIITLKANEQLCLSY